MFKKTVEGVRNLLNKVFGKNNTMLDDKVSELSMNRQKSIDKIAEKLKIGIEQAKNGEVVERSDFLNTIETLKEKHSDTLQELGGDGLMHISKKGKADIVLSEAIVTTRYLDNANVWTIGIGATKSEITNLSSWPIDKELSIEEVFELFNKSTDNSSYVKGVRKALKVDVSQHMFDGLVSFAYNVGVGGMSSSSLVREINNGVTSKKRLKSLLMRWVKSKNSSGRLVFNKGLYNRRTVEAKLMFEGIYKNTKMLGYVIPLNSKHKPMYGSKRVYTVDLNKYL